MAKDYYNILGVGKNASQDEVKQAFRKLAHQHHPDKASGNEAKFKEINEAYQVLSSPEKRRQYDQFGQTFEQAQSQGGYGGFNGFRDFSGYADAFRNGNNQGGQSFEFNFGDLGDLFGDLFSGGTRTHARTRRQTKGTDVHAELVLDFTQAAFGTEQPIHLHKNVTCSRCGGNGAEPGSKVSKCPTCGGSGQVVRNMGFGFGFPSVCPTCNGVGESIDKKCNQCRGQGIVRERKELKIKVPAGVDDSQTIRFRGEGEAAKKGGVAGDLYLTIKIKPHPQFRREGFEVLSNAEINFSQAALGTKIDVETIDGLVTLKIPDGTPSGKVFRLRDRGIPRLNARGRGDHLVTVIVKVPTRLSRQQRKLLEDMQKESL